jgi:transcriptional regulator GlxA family with amidase domain
MRGRDEPARFGVVLYDGVEPIDVGGTIGVVSMAARVLPAIEAVTIAHTAGPVALAGGLTVVARHGFADVPPCDVTIVCGGPGWRPQSAVVPDGVRRARMPQCSASCGAMIRCVSPRSAPAH